ncbi:gamma-glutamyltransferase [Oceanicaulis sp. MMSF_3324]|uniref:gamma-glutamyltransferase n=1 Tax=Oceanicaulis sp. MMSF_3324 TaxID=3046702 RepID=UPI00273D1DEF|nr:gamma-glutamyltransferase [Oceanicaulis sp. MMSF_3324]
MTRIALLSAASALALAGCNAPSESETPAPTPTQPSESRAPVGGMVAAANPDAVKAGIAALQAGGDAVDAAIAIQTVLSLVEPQSSGIGGGAFMVHYDASSGEVNVYNGRERAPMSADEDLFINPETGQPYPYVDAWRSGLSTGAPGAIAMLQMAHAEHGQLDWADNFSFAIDLADNGFEVAPRLNNIAQRMAGFTDMEETGAAADYLFDENGEAWPVGHVLTNPDYAASLRLIADDWRNFYEGDLARAIVSAVNEAPRPGYLTEADLASYEPVKVSALCSPYRDYQICSAPPPASGGIAVGSIMGMLDTFDMSAHGPNTAEGWALFIEASRLAYADRDHYVGDADFVDVPVEGLLDRDYLAARAQLINPQQAIAEVSHGTPPGAEERPEDATDDRPGTSHFVVMDSEGDVVSMTTTVESPFGSGRMAGGFFLNNQLTDFSFIARDEEGRLLPNAVQPGKRPRSSMSPTIVLDANGDFELATGSPGGNSIIAYTAKSLVGMLDWGLSPQEAAALPNVVARGDTVNIEEGFDEAIMAELRDRGFTIQGGRGENSGIHIVRELEDGTLIGAADPRRDGTVEQP